MQAKDLVLKARDEYIASSQDEQFKKAFEKVESLRVEADGEVEELKGYEPDDDLTNYVMNKLLEAARKEGGNMFAGDSSIMNEYIFEFYTDYENLKDQFEDKWSMYIHGVSNGTPKSKKKSVSDTLEDADALAAKEKKLEEEFRKKEEALKKKPLRNIRKRKLRKRKKPKPKQKPRKRLSVRHWKKLRSKRNPV